MPVSTPKYKNLFCQTLKKQVLIRGFLLYCGTNCCIVSLLLLVLFADNFLQNLNCSSLSISVRHIEYSTFKTFCPDRHT